MQVDKFTFFGSFYEAAMMLPESQQPEFVMGILAYAFEGIEPSFEGCLAAMFALAKPNIDSSVKGVANGSKGGRPKGDRNPTGNPLENPPAKPPAETNKDMDRDMDREKEEEVSFSTKKKKPSSNAPVGAAAAKAAPPVACPTCGVPMDRTNATQGKKRIWRCDLCGTETAVEGVA